MNRTPARGGRAGSEVSALSQAATAPRVKHRKRNREARMCSTPEYSGVLHMRASRFLFLCLTLGAVAACDNADTSEPARPPLAGVRFINALADTTSVDVRMVDQI